MAAAGNYSLLREIEADEISRVMITFPDKSFQVEHAIFTLLRVSSARNPTPAEAMFRMAQIPQRNRKTLGRWLAKLSPVY